MPTPGGNFSLLPNLYYAIILYRVYIDYVDIQSLIYAIQLDVAKRVSVVSPFSIQKMGMWLCPNRGVIEREGKRKEDEEIKKKKKKDKTPEHRKIGKRPDQWIHRPSNQPVNRSLRRSLMPTNKRLKLLASQRSHKTSSIDGRGTLLVHPCKCELTSDGRKYYDGMD